MSGVCHKTISAIETNRLRGKLSDLEKLAEQLGVDAGLLLRQPGRKLFTSPLDTHFRQRKYWLPRAERDGVQRMAALAQVCPEVLTPALDLVKARSDSSECLTLLSLVACDSSPEWMVLLQRLSVGDYPTSFSPLEAGFRTHSVVNHKTRRVVGDCPVPGVAGEFGGMRFLMLPHVGIGIKEYTLDILVIVQANGKRHEVDLEVDGPKHISSRDALRKLDLGMLEIRFKVDEVLRPDFNARLMTAIRRVCSKAA